MAASALRVLLGLFILHSFSASVKGQAPYYPPYPNQPHPHPDPSARYPPRYYVQVNPPPAHLYPYDPNPTSNYQTQFLPVSSNYPSQNPPPANYYHVPSSNPNRYYYDSNSYVVPYSGPSAGYPRYEYATVGAPPTPSPSSTPTPGPATGGAGEEPEVDEGAGTGSGGGGPAFNPQVYTGPAQAQPAWPFGQMGQAVSPGQSGNGQLYQLLPALGGLGLLETVANVQRQPQPSTSPFGALNNLASNPLFLMMALESLS